MILYTHDSMLNNTITHVKKLLKTMFQLLINVNAYSRKIHKKGFKSLFEIILFSFIWLLVIVNKFKIICNYFLCNDR